jgi:hypothetical protein
MLVMQTFMAFVAAVLRVFLLCPAPVQLTVLLLGPHTCFPPHPCWDVQVIPESKVNATLHWCHNCEVRACVARSASHSMHATPSTTRQPRFARALDIVGS